MQIVFNVQDARNLAIKAKLLIMEQTHCTSCIRYGGVNNKALSDKGKTLLAVSDTVETANVGVRKGKSVAVEGKGNTYVPTKNNNPYPRPFKVKFYRCGEVGHCSKECPKGKAVNVVEKDDDVLENEVCGLDGDDDYEECEQEEYTCVVRKLMLSSKCGDKTQCHKLFCTRCTVQRSYYDLIFDSGSQENIISKGVVERLWLETKTHPSSYAIGWIKEVGGIWVHERCIVSFSINKYNDEVYCDVVDMDACHILFGRP